VRLIVEVADNDTGRPVPGASVTTATLLQGQVLEQGTTGEDGRTPPLAAESPDFVRVKVKAAGYKERWEEVPAELLELEPGAEPRLYVVHVHPLAAEPPAPAEAPKPPGPGPCLTASLEAVAVWAEGKPNAHVKLGPDWVDAEWEQEHMTKRTLGYPDTARSVAYRVSVRIEEPGTTLEDYARSGSPNDKINGLPAIGGRDSFLFFKGRAHVNVGCEHSWVDWRIPENAAIVRSLAETVEGLIKACP
jgi:hypothetical protein